MDKTHQALIFDIQRFSLHDGPGIRTTVFLKGCPLRCVWCQNPESRKPDVELAFFASKCIHCNACVDICPEGALTHSSGKRTISPKCTACGLCAEKCPSGALRLIGRRREVQEVYDELMRDAEYFVESGGGVTFSGGEPMQQYRFLAELCPLLKDYGIHLAIETCGHFAWNNMAALIPNIDLIYFDLKLMDEVRHKEWTGKSNALILENFSLLARSGAALQARMPVIPGVNDDRGNLTLTAKLLLANGQNTIHCLKSHNMGSSKWDSLSYGVSEVGKPFKCPPVSGEIMESVKTIFHEEGIHATIIE